MLLIFIAIYLRSQFVANTGYRNAPIKYNLTNSFQ